MASLTVRRLSAVGRSHLFHSASSPAAGTKLSVVHARLFAPNRHIFPGDLAKPASSFRVRRFARAATATVHDDNLGDRETSPRVESEGPGPQKSYMERLRGGLNWIPAHWVTVIYKDLLGSNRAVAADDALLLLNCFDARLAEESPENRVKMAEKAWHDLKAVGTPLDVRHYNALLSVYLANDHAFDPEDFLLILSEDGVTMNDESYSLFVRRYCRTGNVVDAMRTLEFMKSKGLMMTRPLFHALISGHVRAGDLEGAERIRAMMNKAYPTAESDFLPAILTHARMGNVDMLLDSFVEMKSGSYKPEVGDVLKALTAYLDWCVEENKYPETSALDSIFDTLKEAAYMMGFNSMVCQTVLQLVRQGFNDVAADLLRLFADAVMAKHQFFKNSVRTLPFTDVLRYCDQIGEVGGTDPMTEYCMPEIRRLPFDQLQRVLIDAKECELPMETIAEIVTSKLPVAARKNDEVEYSIGRSTRGLPLEQVLLLAIQLELPIVKDHHFWETQVFPRCAQTSFQNLYKRLSGAGSQHDQRSIEACESVMIRGFIDSKLKTMNLDRLAVIAKLLRSKPDYVYDGKTGIGIVSRLSHKGEATRNVVPDAVYIMQRSRQFTADNVGHILRRLSAKDPDPVMIASIINAAKDNGVFPRMSLIAESLNQARNPELQKVLKDYIECCRNDYLETRVLEKMSLKEIMDYEGRDLSRSAPFVVVSKAAACGDEETALNALSHIRSSDIRSSNTKALALTSIIDMYVNVLGDGFKASEYLDVLVRDYGAEKNVRIPVPTLLRLVEILLQNGRPLADLQLFEEIAQTDIKLVSPYGDHDRRVFADHLSFVSSSLNEDKEAIDAYFGRFSSLNLGPYFADMHVASVLKSNGVKEALELVKTYFDGEEKTAGEKKIPHEELLLDAIVASEDVALLKEFLDVSYVVHGERNAFLHLAFALYKGGKYAQGRRILNIPGLRADEGLVPRFCNRLLAEERYEALESFCDDICCLFGVEKPELSFYKLRSFMAKGDNLKALEYFNQSLNENKRMNDELKQQAASLYEKLNLEFPDKSVTAKDHNEPAIIQQTSPFDGNMTDILKNIRGGTEYPLEFYKYLVGTLLVNDPAPALDALVQRGNLAALEYLDSENVKVKSHLALAYLRADRSGELLRKCDASERPEEYLTPDILQYVRIKGNSDELIRQIEELAVRKGADALIGNVVGFHLSRSQLEKAKALIAEHPAVLKGGHLPLVHVNSNSTLRAISEMDLPEKIKGNVFYRLIHNAALWNVPAFVKEAVDLMYASNIEFYISPSLRSRVRNVVGKDLFIEHTKAKESKSDESASSLEDFIETELIADIPDVDVD